MAKETTDETPLPGCGAGVQRRTRRLRDFRGTNHPTAAGRRAGTGALGHYRPGAGARAHHARPGSTIRRANHHAIHRRADHVSASHHNLADAGAVTREGIRAHHVSATHHGRAHGGRADDPASRGVTAASDGQARPTGGH